MTACKNCSQNFKVTDFDRDFYKKMDVPEPTFCPDCRQMRRLTYRNERGFYKRKCDFDGCDVVSVYSPDKEVKVFHTDNWWKDDWDGFEHGREFDFNRPFFDQFLELSKEVPRPAMINFNSENSIYTNHSAYNKNCYMCINTGYCEDNLYTSNYSIFSKNCTDCLAIFKSELCYFCTDIKNSTSSSFLNKCISCHNCHFMYDCQSCEDCFGCWNLRHKKYHIFNEKYSKEVYEKKLEEIKPKNWDETMAVFNNFNKLVKENAIHKASIIQQSENCSGDYLHNNKNVKDSYNVFDSEDCAYCYDSGEANDCLDVSEPYKAELSYETHACNENIQAIGNSKSYENNDIYYSQYCWYCSDVFGCFGLKKQKYCILNKKYSKEEYFELKAKIIDHMKKTGEWGEFFPAIHSPFEYNETVANVCYPLKKEEALAKGYKWKDPDPKEYKVAQGDIKACSDCGKNYKYVPQELDFYKRFNYPLPEKCADCRHKMRMALRNPRKLWNRECDKCKKEVSSTYSSDRSEKVYCEECYLNEIH